MLTNLALWIVHWFLALLIAILPNMGNPPAWLVSISSPIAYAWHMLDGFANATVLLSFFGALVPIVIAYEIFHFTHQNTLALRGTSVDKSHL